MENFTSFRADKLSRVLLRKMMPLVRRVLKIW
jgi:hypothetical protein